MKSLLSSLIQELKSWQKRSPQLAITIYAVISIHLFLIIYFLAEKEVVLKKKTAIAVHTISLNPPKEPKTLTASLEPVVVAEPIETLEVTPTPQKPTECPPQAEEKPKPKKEPPSKPKEDKKTPEVKPKSDAKPPKPNKPKEDVKKEKTKKEASPPPKPKKEDSPKKEESPKKKEPQTSKESLKKDTPKKESKETASSNESPSKKKPAETTEKQKERSAEQQKLLAEALASLDQASSTKSSAPTSKTTMAPLIAPPGALSGESLETAQREYKDELARHLKLLLKLPEYGPVKIELLVRREGTVASLKILSSESSLNRNYVEANLPKHRLPPFAQSFPGEKEQIFVLTLTNQ